MSKKIIEEKIKSVKLILHILLEIKNGSPFNEALLKKNHEFESNDREWLVNRKNIREYIKKLIIGIFK